MKKYSKEHLDKVIKLENMHEVMMSMNDEECYFEWIYTVPDGADKDDFDYIASDLELYKDVCKLYDALYQEYHDGGLYKPSPVAYNYAMQTDKRLNLNVIEVFV